MSPQLQRRSPAPPVHEVLPMKPMSVVLTSSQHTTNEAVLSRMQEYFRQIAIADTIDGLHTAILKHRAETVFIDLTVLSLEDVARLHSLLEHVRIVCTHTEPADALQEK